ncbi:MAG: hypothetical protein R1F52_00375 [Candidatus Nitrosoabyssus spongiisocia]|nr:MAG: hypothetical protein R1F52_00375 [Nitrosopumilaceae archaeon AB1(1)]
MTPFRFIFLYVIIILPLLFISILTHELGHIIACVADGSDYTLNLDNFPIEFASVFCPDIIYKNIFYLWGGSFSFILFAIPLLFKKIRQNILLKAILFSILSLQLLTAIAETFFHTAYILSIPLLQFLLILPLFPILIYFLTKCIRDCKVER